MTDPTTPTTEAGRALWDVEVTLRAFIVRIEAEAAAQARADERRRLAGLALHGLEVLHSPHFGWGCNAANCSGQAAIDALSDTEPAP